MASGRPSPYGAHWTAGIPGPWLERACGTVTVAVQASWGLWPEHLPELLWFKKVILAFWSTLLFNPNLHAGHLPLTLDTAMPLSSLPTKQALFSHNRPHCFGSAQLCPPHPREELRRSCWSLMGGVWRPAPWAAPQGAVTKQHRRRASWPHMSPRACARGAARPLGSPSSRLPFWGMDREDGRCVWRPVLPLRLKA